MNFKLKPYVFMTQIGLLLVALSISSTSKAADFQGNLNNRVNVSVPPLFSAGMFRLESERSYKLSLQMVLGILNGHTQVERSHSLQSVTRFQKELQKVSNGSEKAGRALKKVNLALSDQVDGLNKLNAKTASYMYDVNEDLLNKLNFLTFAIESESNDDVSHLVGLAMRQASLAQRMAKIILLQSLDTFLASKQGLQVDLTQSRIEFVNGMDLLSEEVSSDQALKFRLNLAMQQWKFYDIALSALSAKSAKKLKIEDLRNISSTSDRIAQMMIEIVRLSYGLSPDPTVIAER